MAKETRTGGQRKAKSVTEPPRTASPDKAIEQAIRLLAANRLDEAGRLCQQVLKASPHHGGALHAQGLVYLKSRLLPQAVEAFQEAISRQPSNPQFHANLGEALRRSKRLDEALAAFQRAFVLLPEFLNAHLGIGNTLRDLKRLPEAMAQFRVAVAIDPRFAEGYHYLGLTLKEAGDAPGALAVLRKAVALKKNYTEAELSLGNALEDMGKYEEAAQVFQGLLAHDPGHAGALNNLGNIYRLLGKMKEASECYSKVLAKDPSNAQARYNLSRTGKSGEKDKGSVDEIAAMLAQPDLTDAEKVPLHFSLGKIYDDLSDYGQAFHHFMEGNRLDQRQPGYDGAAHEALVQRIMAICGKEFFAKRRGMGSESQRPVFILGMPRSGTTLTEQILASHPSVYGGGERPDIPDIAARLHHVLKIPQTYPDCLPQADSLSLCKLAEEYLDQLPQAAALARLVTDKLPPNFHHLGLIALLFPNARILHCRRNPLDTCLSCFFQFFSQVMPFSRDLSSLGRYYRAYVRLMDHWRKTLPLAVLDVDYEAMVADQEGMTRRILDFCGLEWNDACLRFFETERAVKTASVWQVRQPLYASSVERWKHYERFIGPLKESLGDLAPR